MAEQETQLLENQPLPVVPPGSGFHGSDVPAESDMYRCVHCGLCLSSCPTYTTLKVEPESPRGRIALMKAVNEGRAAINPTVVSHWEKCLQCRACEAVCPSGVPYGRIMENTRAQVLSHGMQSEGLRRMSRLFLRAALPHPRRLRLGAQLAKMYQKSGFQKLVRASGLLNALPGGMAGLESQLPDFTGPFFSPSNAVHPAVGEKKLTVGLLSGCVMPLMQGSTMSAAVRVLTRNGCDVAVPVGQGCCGALNIHSGDLDTARDMARRNMDVFRALGVEAIVTASAGCGSAMKEYEDLLRGDPEYAGAARSFARMTVDITELLASLPLDPPRMSLSRKVTYQDPCHLAHAQRITAQPREVLKAIPGVELVEMEQSTMCCGSAGIYSMVQPELSGQILDRKLDNIIATGSEQVVTANPGCMSQIERGLRQRGLAHPVTHVVDLLDEAYRAEDGG